MAQSTTTTPLAETWARSGQAPLWVAVALYAASHADDRGAAHMRPGQLRAAVAPGSSAATLSGAIKRAIAAGWLLPDSSAWCLRLSRPVVTDGP